jgi:uncharacterized Ntn-hydrolase superfamily protein
MRPYSYGTYSIVAYDPEKNDFGVAVASKFIAVGHIVPWAEVNVGAVATQSYANATYGPRALKMLKEGMRPEDVIEKLLEGDSKRGVRQIGIVSRDGAYAYTGDKCIEWAGHIIGDYYAIQGNILTGPEVIEAMDRAYRDTKGELVDKLLSSLRAGEEAGGDKRGRQSAAILVVRECGGYGGCEEGVGRYVDLRVDDHHDPVKELYRLFRIWELLLLEREDPKDIVKWDDVWEDIMMALIKLGYLSEEVLDKDDKRLIEAFEKWIGINNFENKLRSDGYIWGTIYRYLIDTSRG